MLLAESVHSGVLVTVLVLVRPCSKSTGDSFLLSSPTVPANSGGSTEPDSIQGLLPPDRTDETGILGL